jgi:hypothetical protein
MDIKNLTPSQKKILSAGVIILGVFLIFFIFIYLPSKNAVHKIQAELSITEKQIKDIDAIIGETKSIDQAIIVLKERLQYLNSKFPQKEEESIKMFADLAKKYNIEIKYIKPQPKKPVVDEDGKELKIGNKICQSIYVSLEMKCFYKDLVLYAHGLKEELPAFVSIENLEIIKDSSGLGKLDVTVDLNLYFLP